MKNIFTYFPHEKIYHIHLGIYGRRGDCIVCQEGFDTASSYQGTWSNVKNYSVMCVNKKPARLHRLILNAPDCYDVDHINGNTMDNRKCNLQLVTEQQNAAKGKLYSANKSGYRGVTWHMAGSKWRTQITVNGRSIHLGIYDTKEEAALAYNEAALKHFGNFASLNIIKQYEH